VPTASVAKHALIARTISQDIRNGRYKVGGFLPSEPDLARLFGVSRQTIRVALRNLREMGLVQPQQGVGNIVRSNAVTPRYSQSFESAADILQYAAKTSPEIIGKIRTHRRQGHGGLASLKEGERWLKIESVRRLSAQTNPIAFTRSLYRMRSALRSRNTAAAGVPMFTLLEKKFGESECRRYSRSFGRDPLLPRSGTPARTAAQAGAHDRAALHRQPRPRSRSIAHRPTQPSRSRIPCVSADGNGRSAGRRGLTRPGEPGTSTG